MSLELSLMDHSKACKTCGEGAKEVFEINVTYNLGRMWQHIAPDMALPQRRLLDIGDLTGEESLSIISPALENLILDWDRAQGFNPSNGWGSAKTLLTALASIQRAAREYPKAVWKAYR